MIRGGKFGHPKRLEDEGADVRCRLMAEALAELGDDAVHALREAYLAESVGRNKPCLLYALGKSRSPQSLEVLDELVDAESGTAADDVLYAIAMKGDAGKELLQRITRDGRFRQQKVAEEWLQRIEKGESLEETHPRPPSGSLPTKLQDP